MNPKRLLPFTDSEGILRPELKSSHDADMKSRGCDWRPGLRLRALDALAKEGYAEAELDQIGDMEGEPDDEPHLSAFQGALEGEISIVTFNETI